MRRPVFREVLVFALVALSTWACGSSSTTPTTPTTPTPTAITTTETFTGTLTLNGAASYSFTANDSGTVTATLTSLADPGVAVGISLGTWNGTSCQIVIANDSASQGTVVTGSVSAAGVLCARIYDAGAKLTVPLAYTLTVIHP